MRDLETPFVIFPLGDSAITIDLGNLIEEGLNGRALAIAAWLKDRPFPGLLDIIVAYSSVSVFYDPFTVRNGDTACPDGVFGIVRRRLEEAWAASSPMSGMEAAGPLVRIPVCYEEDYGPDLSLLGRAKGLSREEIIDLHGSVVYRIFMIGFLPGFPYMGKVDPLLAMGRKQRPVPVAAGGVGIAGDQTGIYPVNSPGGWHIIGRTPLSLFDPHAPIPVLLKPGDPVQFVAISAAEFRELSQPRAVYSGDGCRDR